LDITIKVGLMLRLAFGQPWRQTEGRLGSIMDLLSLDLAVPDHTMFSRRSVGRGSATALKKTSARGNRQQRRRFSGPESGCMRNTAARRTSPGESSIGRLIPTATRASPGN
jgi:hypothetical protein